MKKKFYKIFVVEVCTTSYAMDNVLIGAENKEDLLKHLPEIPEILNENNEDKDFILGLNNGDYYPHELNAWTDTPYVILERFAYYE